MTIASLNAEIEAARRQFTHLNAGRKSRRTHYERRSPDTERLIVLAAERVARLCRFKSYLYAKNYQLNDK